MKKKIFISHAVKDKELADSLVDLLQTGMDIKSKDIFCSSLEGLGIPSGSNFIEHIKAQLQSPEIVLALLSPNFFESQFCLCELGSTWAMSHNFIPIVVPPATYTDLKGVLLPTQLIDITNPTKLTEFQMQVDELLGLKVNPARWESKRNKFLKDLPKIIENIDKPSFVPMEKFLELEDKYDQSLIALEDCDEKMDHLNEQISELRNAKNREDVKEIDKKYSDQSLLDEFKNIIKEINAVLSMTSSEVSTFILSDYYSHPYQINWYQDKEEFSEAERYRIVSVADDEEKV